MLNEMKSAAGGKKIILVLFSVIICLPVTVNFLYAGGLQFGMPAAAKSKVKELDEKVKIKKAAQATVQATVKMPIAEWRIDESGTGATWGIALDSVGNMYASEIFSNKIKKFSPTGTFITQWGSAGTGNGQFQFVDFVGGQQGPEGDIAVDSTGAVYVIQGADIAKYAP